MATGCWESAPFASQRAEFDFKWTDLVFPMTQAHARTSMKLSLLFLISTLLIASSGEPQRHIFTSGDHVIIMDISFFDPYEGRRLGFHSSADPRKEICLVGNPERGYCPDRFVGAVVAVRFTIKRVGGKLQGKTSIREYVTVIAQSPELPARASLEKTQVLRNGAISDLQVFGYDESDIAEGAREAERQKSKERLWRLCRQELYLNGDTAPFAIVTWRYTLEAIEILSLRGK